MLVDKIKEIKLPKREWTIQPTEKFTRENDSEENISKTD